MKGWTGRRLCVDLNSYKFWVEEIPKDNLERFVGGRGFNAKFFVENPPPSVSVFSPESPIAFSVAPLSGTLAPCSGWTSISAYSPLLDPPRYVHASMPGHWGPYLKFAGFDQLILLGKSENPIYIAIGDNKVRFEDARQLWGKDVLETTVSIQDQKEGRNAEVLCIGPAGENLVRFANVTNRLSWAGDHVGLGFIFGSKNLKALVVRGEKPVILDQPDRFLQLCHSLRERILHDRNASLLREEGPFFFLGRNGGGLGIKNYTQSSYPNQEERWRIEYLNKYLYGREGCFSCPIHCGRISQVNDNYFGGVHFESTWSLGPRIGIFDMERTLRLVRTCQLEGLDPSSFGSLVSWLMDCCDQGILSTRDIGSASYQWGDPEATFQLIERILDGKETGEIFRQGSSGVAKAFGKGLELVPHSGGLDLPARDPRSSTEYALSRALFPDVWDYLQSLPERHPTASSGRNGIVENVSLLQKLRILADMNSMCPLVVVRLQLVSESDIGQLISAATGIVQDSQKMEAAIYRTIQIESTLLGMEQRQNGDPLPLRFFGNPVEGSLLEEQIKVYNTRMESDGSSKQREC